MYLPNLEILYNSIFYYRNSTIVIRITINYHTTNNRHLINAKRKKEKTNTLPPKPQSRFARIQRSRIGSLTQLKLVIAAIPNRKDIS